MSLGSLLFGENKNKTDYRQAAYDKYYKDISGATYDKVYSGLSDYLDENYTGGSKKFKFDTMKGLEDTAKNSLANYKATRYNAFGDGIVGGILNPVYQTATGLTDLLGMGATAAAKGLGADVKVSNKWADKDELGTTRDWLSDLGAAGTTALDVLTYGNLGALKAPATAAGAALKQGALGAGYGLTGALRTTGAENFDPQTLALSTLIGGGIGGLTGAATYGLGKLTSSLDKKAISQKLSDYAKSGGKNEYQQALETLKNNGVDTSTAEALKKSSRTAIKKAAQNASGSDVNETTSAIKEAAQKILGGSSDEDIAANFTSNMAKATEPVSAKLDLSSIPRVPAKNLQEALSNIKNNVQTTKLYNTLYNSKLGRLGLKAAPAAAVAGGAYGLSRLGRNNNNNQTLADYYATLGQE